MFWLILIVVVILLCLTAHIFKIPKFGNMVLVTGGVKTGKSTMSVWLACRQYWRQKRKYYIYNYVIYPLFKPLRKFKRFKRMRKKEYPLFYSNIPVAVKGYTPLTRELIERKTRFRYGSVIYVCESSLVADSMSFRNELLNEEMLLLNKLIAHETRGGYLFYDTQSAHDNHFAVRRCLSQYFYIHHLTKWIPFFAVAWVRELKYSGAEDGSNNEVNVFNEDVEETLKAVVIPKSTWRRFDCYCYSIFTDHLPVEDRQKDVGKWDRKKASKIVSFKNYQTIEKRFILDADEKKS